MPSTDPSNRFSLATAPVFHLPYPYHNVAAPRLPSYMRRLHHVPCASTVVTLIMPRCWVRPTACRSAAVNSSNGGSGTPQSLQAAGGGHFIYAPPTTYQQYVRSYVNVLDRVSSRRQTFQGPIPPPRTPEDDHTVPEGSLNAAVQRFQSPRAVRGRSRELLCLAPVFISCVLFIDDWQNRMVALRTRRKIVDTVKS